MRRQIRIGEEKKQTEEAHSEIIKKVVQSGLYDSKSGGTYIRKQSKRNKKEHMEIYGNTYKEVTFMITLYNTVFLSLYIHDLLYSLF